MAFKDRAKRDIDTHLATKVDIAELRSSLAQKMLYSFVATVAVLGGLITVLEFRQPERILDSLERIERRLPPLAIPATPVLAAGP